MNSINLCIYLSIYLLSTYLFIIHLSSTTYHLPISISFLMILFVHKILSDIQGYLLYDVGLYMSLFSLQIFHLSYFWPRQLTIY